MNEAHKQYSLLDTLTMFFILGLQANIYTKVVKTYYMSAARDAERVDMGSSGHTLKLFTGGPDPPDLLKQSAFCLPHSVRIIDD